MFKPVKIASLLWPVEIEVPKQDGSGEHDTFEIKVEYKALDRDQLAAIAEPQAVGDKPFDVYQFIDGWKDVFNEDDSPKAFSQRELKKLCKLPYFYKGVVGGFWLCQQGYAGKN